MRKIVIFLMINLFYRIKWFITKRIDCYVDSENGNNKYIGFNKKRPVKSLQLILDRIPSIIKYKTKINLRGSSSEQIKIENKFNKQLLIDGGDDVR